MPSLPKRLGTTATHRTWTRSEEHTSERQTLIRNSYAAAPSYLPVLTPSFPTRRSSVLRKAEGRRDYDESALVKASEAQRAIVAGAAKSKSEARRVRLAQERTRSYARNKDLGTPTTSDAQPSETPWHHSDAPDLD